MSYSLILRISWNCTLQFSWTAFPFVRWILDYFYLDAYSIYGQKYDMWGIHPNEARAVVRFSQLQIFVLPLPPSREQYEPAFSVRSTSSSHDPRARNQCWHLLLYTTCSVPTLSSAFSKAEELNSLTLLAYSVRRKRFPRRQDEGTERTCVWARELETRLRMQKRKLQRAHTNFWTWFVGSLT